MRADDYFARAMLALQRRDYAAAVHDLTDAIKLDPSHLEAWVARGNVRHAQGQFFDALLHFDRALGVDESRWDAWNGRGMSFQDLGMWRAAEESFRSALSAKPTIEPHMNLANLYAGLCRLDEAASEYEAAIRFEPGNYEAHLNLGVTLLGMGDWHRGFEEYSWRHRGTMWPPKWQTDYPVWQGEDLDRKTLLLWPEQGYGDEICFARVRHLINLRWPSARVIVKARGPLRSLLETRGGEDTVIDMQASQIDAWGLLDLDPMNLPPIPPVMNVRVTDDMVLRAGTKLPAGFKVGLCWESGQRPLQPETHATAANKSIPLASLERLVRTPGCRFVSLQKEHRDQALMRDFGIFDPMEDAHDFADTAAIIANLDLVISVDTAVAHLAGAMDREVWNFVRFSGYWPWLTPQAAGDPEAAIWYPSMRLLRQPRLFDWAEPIARAEEMLRERVREEKAA